MAVDQMISDLAELAAGAVAANDELAIVDVSDPAMNAAGTTKFARVGSLFLPARFAPYANPAPADGDVWYGPSQRTLDANLNGVTHRLVGCLFTGTADVTVSGASDQGVLGAGVGTTTLPAGYLVPGKTLRVGVRGQYTTGGSGGTLTFKLTLGAAVIATASRSVSVNMTGRQWYAEVVLTCRASGASGSVVAAGTAAVFTTSSAMTVLEFNSNGPVPLDTTTALAVGLTVNPGGATNSFTAQLPTIEALN